jgi:hypothetical protein
MLALSILVAVVFIGKRLIDLAGENSRRLEATKKIDGGIRSLLASMRDDIESMVLLAKDQPVFEIHEKENAGGFEMFFFTTNHEDNVTVAVKYDVNELEFGKIEVSRVLLDPKATIALQNSMTAKSSFERSFERVAKGAAKDISSFGIPFSDVKIRVAVRTIDGGFVLTRPNRSMAYTNGLLSFGDSKVPSIEGALLFFDVVARGLVAGDFNRLKALWKKDIADAKDFLYTVSRRSTARIVCTADDFR